MEHITGNSNSNHRNSYLFNTENNNKLNNVHRNSQNPILLNRFLSFTNSLNFTNILSDLNSTKLKKQSSTNSNLMRKSLNIPNSTQQNLIFPNEFNYLHYPHHRLSSSHYQWNDQNEDLSKFDQLKKQKIMMRKSKSTSAIKLSKNELLRMESLIEENDGHEENGHLGRLEFGFNKFK